MSGLLQVLAAEEEAISSVLAEKLPQTGCATLTNTPAGDPAVILQTLSGCCAEQDDAPLHDWAVAVADQESSPQVPCDEVLAALHCVEEVVRYYVVKTISQKKALLSAMAELSDLIDRLRRRCVATLSAQSPEAAEHLESSKLERLEEFLNESQARKHAILESSLDPIITIDHRGVITEFNRAAEQTFGHSREKVLGTQPSEVLFPPDTSAGEQNRIDRYLDAGEGSLLGKRAEVTAVRANGEKFPAEMAMTINQEQGAPVLTFFVRDISQRKKAEREQGCYAAELARSNRELEQFAYLASHDLQEPLRKISTFSQRLETKCGDALDETGHECVRRMQNAADRMQKLIEGLLTLSRVTTRGQDFEPVDLTQVAREVVSDLETQIERVEGRVEVEKLPTIQADRVQMRQLLQNLIGNGLKFHRDDEPPVVEVRGRFAQRRQQRAARRAAGDEQCCLLVEDNGIGFDEKYLQRIFDVFARLHPRDVYEGTGIGLAICRRIVSRHGGSITARSTLNRGTMFEVRLPVVQAKKKKKG